MIWVVHQVLSSGSPVVLDLGCIPPSAAELAHDPVPAAPSGHESWFDRASRRWPTLPRLDLSPLPERLSHDRPT